MGHVPIIDINKRRSDAIPLSPAEKHRYCERSGVERTNSDLKDNYDVHHIRVKGHWKVLCHLMFSIIALTVKQRFYMLNERFKLGMTELTNRIRDTLMQNQSLLEVLSLDRKILKKSPNWNLPVQEELFSPLLL